MVTLREDLHTCLIISRWILGMRNVSDKNCRDNEHTHFVFQYISNKMQLLTQFIYIWKLLYMFRVVPPPIIRSACNDPKHVERFPDINKLC